MRSPDIAYKMAALHEKQSLATEKVGDYRLAAYYAVLEAMDWMQAAKDGNALESVRDAVRLLELHFDETQK